MLDNPKTSVTVTNITTSIQILCTRVAACRLVCVIWGIFGRLLKMIIVISDSRCLADVLSVN